MRAVFDFVRVIADSESNVLIVGETGTGKETIAALIHQLEPRRRGPFVPVSCAILTETLIESELFGHERGAFTGALRDHPGRFELADGGTIFLDDIDDVPRSVQVKLLRVLQNRTIERVGGTRADSDRRADHHRIEAEPAADRRGRAVPRGPLLSPERRADLAAAAARAARRHPGAGRPFPPSILRRARRRACPRSRRWSGRRSTATRGRATCASSRTRASASPRRARARRCAWAACPPACCFRPAAACRRRRCGRTCPPRPARLAGRAAAGSGDRTSSPGRSTRATATSRARPALLRIKRSTLGDRIRRLGLDHPAADGSHTKSE